MSSAVLVAEVKYTQRIIKGFDLRGMPIYVEVNRVHVVYACSHDELKRNIKNFESSIKNISTYCYHRHPRTYIEVLP